LTEQLGRQRLLPLSVARLREAGARPPPALAAKDEQARPRARAWALTCEHATASLVGILERAGVPTLALKGASLARRLYGDASLRTSNDIDLLVVPEQLAQATAKLLGHGYRLAPSSPPSAVGLPPLHHTLEPETPGRPPIDLHWRVHWYECAFSKALLARSRCENDGLRRPAAPDELASLLLFYARDGFLGLRYAADIGAWWDRHGADLPSGGLEPIAAAHPELRPALTAAAIQAERLVGVPRTRVMPASACADRRVGLAVRLSNWAGVAEIDQRIADQVLVDLLLTPPGGRAAFARRFLMPSASSVVRYEHLPPGDRPSPRVWALIHPAKVLTRLVLGLASLRRGAERNPLPSVASTGAGA